MPLNGLEIVLAGGAGGIGSVCAQVLAAEGAKLIVSYRANRQRAERLKDIASLMQADLTIAGDRRRLLDAAPSLYGLVVFAGDPSRVKSPEEFEPAARASLENNYSGPMLLARDAAERMKASGTHGAIVLFSTMQAVALFPGTAAYAVPKAALIHGARLLAKECRGPADIRVNVIAPGVTAAGMAEASIAAGKYQRYLDEGIIPRYGRADDLARAVRFFLEPDNFVTGQVLTVDGGLTL
ncbi:MAG: SDR family oxidoreductase [Bryobacteraceae bacterium]|nr:SDR family oxidoreductase [Bryobacteraceae bacterium]